MSYLISIVIGAVIALAMEKLIGSRASGWVWTALWAIDFIVLGSPMALVCALVFGAICATDYPRRA